LDCFFKIYGIKMKKIGIAFHSVIMESPQFFSKLTQRLVDSDYEVHILTGNTKSKMLYNQLYECSIHYTHVFSITDWLVSQNINIDDIYEPIVDNDIWDQAKRMYCTLQSIDIHIDGISTYGKYFDTTEFIHYDCSDMNADSKIRAIIDNQMICDKYPCNKQCPQYNLYKSDVRKAIVDSELGQNARAKGFYRCDEQIDKLVEDIFQRLCG